ncbi:MAG: hypothetical protein GXP14_05540 [Gammaproteobacteria bacterium]|nr:hypothetical protein [Gammaproteobacteria bacterium]
MLSILIIFSVSVWAIFRGFMALLGMGDFRIWIAILFFIYVATSFLLGQWIKSTRLGNVSASIAFAVVIAYFSLINPVLIVKPLADENIAIAQYWMGYFHETGTGGTTGKNEKFAREWYSKAGKQGHINAAHAAIKLLPLKNYDRIALLKLLAANKPDGGKYYDLWQSTSFMPYSSKLEQESDADKWLTLAAEYGHRDAILHSMNKKYSLESSCRLSPKSYEALPEFEKWVSAYEKNRGKSNFDEKELQSFKERVTCLARKVAEAKTQDKQLAKHTQDLFSTNVQIRVSALTTLKKMGPRAIAAIPDLLKVTQSRNSSTAWHALIAINKIDPQGEIVAEKIVAMLSHQAAHIRENGAYGVALYADVLPNAITPLDKLLEDPNNNVAGRAALALSEYGKLANTSLEKINALTKRRDGRLNSYARQAYNKIKNER